MTLTPTTDFLLNQELEQHGYSVIPFLNEEACAELSELYARHSSKTDSGFFCTMFSESEDERRLVDAGLKKILGPHLKRLFTDHEPLFGNFMVKEPGAQSDWPVHQDWTYVDETVSDSFAIWIPLVELDSRTGHLCMVPGSHNIRNLVRGPGVTDPFRHLHELIREELNVPLEMKAGEAAVWNHRTLHFSNPNLSEQTRVAATIILVPKGVETFHFWKESSVEQTSVEQFDVNSEFFLRNDIFKRPEGVGLVGTHRDDFPDVSEQELRAVVEKSMKHICNPLKRAVFRAPELQLQFERDGYVIVDLLDRNEINELKKILGKLQNNQEGVSYSTDSDYKLSFFADESSYRQKVFNTLSKFFEASVSRFLLDYEPLIVNSFDKQPGTGEVPIHQNWTFVDESRFRSVSVWVPLIDTTRTNGTMEIVYGSHEFLSRFRSPSIPWTFENLRDMIRDEYMQPINTKVGQAVILDDSILHYTSKNDSNTLRTAVQLIMKPKEAAAIHYYKEPDSDQVSVFEVDSVFFTRFKMNDAPNAPKVGSFTLNQEMLSEEAFRQMAANHLLEMDR